MKIFSHHHHHNSNSPYIPDLSCFFLPPTTSSGSTRTSFKALQSALMNFEGKAVKNSLLHLVMDEDIPLLLEAMAEENVFTFDDYSSTCQSVSTSCLSQQQGKREAKNVSFLDEPPKVFSYVDELSASSGGGEWEEGYTIPYSQYQRMALKNLEATTQQFMELSKWRQQTQLSVT